LQKFSQLGQATLNQPAGPWVGQHCLKAIKIAIVSIQPLALPLMGSAPLFYPYPKSRNYITFSIKS